jgi:hypothetical protein
VRAQRRRPARLVRRERQRFAKCVDGIGKTFGGNRRHHDIADRIDVAWSVVRHLRRHDMRIETTGAYRDAAFAAEPTVGAKLATLGLQVQTVAGFDFDGGDAFADQRVEARQGEHRKFVLARLARGPDRRHDAAAGARDLRIIDTGEALLELVRPVAAVDEMGVTIDQARRDPASLAIDPLGAVPAGRQIGIRAGEGNAPVPRGNRAPRHDVETGVVRPHRDETRVVPDARRRVVRLSHQQSS